MATSPRAKHRPPRSKLFKLIPADGAEGWGICHDTSERPWRIHPFSPQGDEERERFPWRVIAKLQAGGVARMLVAFEQTGTAQAWLRREAPGRDWEHLLGPFDADTAITPEQLEAAQEEHRRRLAQLDGELLPGTFEAWKRLREADPGHTLELYNQVACAEQATEMWVPAGGDVPIASGYQPRSCRWHGTAVIADRDGGQLWTAADLDEPDADTDPCSELSLDPNADKLARTS